MLEKPELQHDLLKTRLSDAYGLRVTHFAFLPLGADINTAVYRVEAGDDGAQGRAYFLKLRRGPVNEMSVAIPAFLAGQGIRQIIAPIRAGTGQLWSRLEPCTITLYRFVDGVNGYEVDLSEQQWAELGAALKRIHSASLPAWFRRGLPRETFSSCYRDRVSAFQARLPDATFADPIAAELAAILQARAAVVWQLLEGAELLGRLLQGRTQDFRLCHADIHNGNILIGNDGSLYIVDWDTTLLAPIERDLMFVGSGIGRVGKPAQERDWFYQGYGRTEIDPAALAYYRCERIVQDIDAFSEQILSTTENSQDRRQGLRYLTSQFQPNGVVEIALESYAAAEALSAP